MAFPDSIPAFVTLVDNVDTCYAAHMNDRGTEITNIATALGTNLKNVLPTNFVYGLTAVTNTSDADHDVDYGALICRDDGDTEDIEVEAMTKRFDATFVAGTGNGGMQSGSSLGNDTGYLVYAIDDSTRVLDGDYQAVPIGTAFALPAGYDIKRLVSFFATDGSGNIIPFHQYDDLFTYDEWVTIDSGISSEWTSIDLTNYVPASLSTFCWGTAGGGNNIAVTNDSGVGVDYDGSAKRNQYSFTAAATGTYQWMFDILTANTIYWFADDAGCTVFLHGFRMNLLRT